MKIFDKIEEILAAVCLVVMAILTFANVIARYLFSASFSFSEEITTYLFVLLSMLGTAIAAKRRAHLGLSIVTDAVGPKAEKILRIIGYVAAVLFRSHLLLRDPHGDESENDWAGYGGHAVAGMDFRILRPHRGILCYGTVYPGTDRRN